MFSLFCYRDELLGLKTEPDLEPEIYLENGHSPHLAEEEEEEDMHDLDDDLAGSEEEEEEEEEQAAMDTTSDTQRSIQSVSPYGQLSTNQELYLQSLQQQAQHQDGLLLPPVMSTMASWGVRLCYCFKGVFLLYYLNYADMDCVWSFLILDQRLFLDLH